MRIPVRSGLLAALLAFAVTSCSSEPKKVDAPTDGKNQTANQTGAGKQDPAEKPADKPAEKPADKPAEKPAEKPVAMPDQTPNVFRVRFETTCGDFVVEANRDWAPRGVDRFYELVKGGFYKDIAFFRVIPGFMAQFGIHGDPETAGEWSGQAIKDDPVKQSNTRGMLTFATAGPNTRTTQMFINFADRNAFLDGQGFSPFAKVVEGMDVVDKIYQVGEGAPRGPGPSQGRIKRQGNASLKESYPKLDYIKRAVYVPAK